MARSTGPLAAAGFKRQEAASRASEMTELGKVQHDEMPFTKFRFEKILQKKNGLSINPTYANDTACAQFIGIIADTMKSKKAHELA